MPYILVETLRENNLWKNLQKEELSMTDIEPTNSGPLSPEEAQAKAAILAECEELAAARVTFVAVHFDGYGRQRCHRRSAVL